MKVVYVGPFDAVEVDGIAGVVTRGVPVEVVDELAVLLLAQEVWTAPAGKGGRS